MKSPESCRPIWWGRATGGVSAFTFLGVATGPMVFSVVIAVFDSYPAAFLVVGTIALGPAVLLARGGRAEQGNNRRFAE